jgi:hypothetical protein
MASEDSSNRDIFSGLSSNEVDDPLHGYWPFLLIVRTGRFVTAHSQSVQRRCGS